MEFEGGIFHNSRRFRGGSVREEKFALVPIVDKILVKEMVRGHRSRRSSGYWRSLDRLCIGIPSIEGEQVKPS